MKKTNCNQPSIGQEGTAHIRWQCAGAFIAANLKQLIDRIVFGSARKHAQPNPAARRSSASLRRAAVSGWVVFSAVTGLGATVVGTIQDVTLQPYGGVNNAITFTPLSCPQAVAVVTNGVTNQITVWDVARTARLTNGSFRVNLAGGLYFAALATPMPFSAGSRVKILVPPNDTNTYQFNTCANLATNLGTFVWTNTPQGFAITTSNSPTVTFTGNGTSTNPLVATAVGMQGGVVEGVFTVTNQYTYTPQTVTSANEGIAGVYHYAGYENGTLYATNENGAIWDGSGLSSPGGSSYSKSDFEDFWVKEPGGEQVDIVTSFNQDSFSESKFRQVATAAELRVGGTISAPDAVFANGITIGGGGCVQMLLSSEIRASDGTNYLGGVGNNGTIMEFIGSGSGLRFANTNGARFTLIVNTATNGFEFRPAP